MHADAEAGLIPARVWERILPTADVRELIRTAVRLLVRGESVTMNLIADPKTVTHGQVRSTCCEPQRFHAGPEVGRRWRDSHPSMTVLPVVEAYAGSAYPLDD